ncbi:Vitamin B12-binding protein [Austwickia sp. TVS 96-490-7B]|uniref:ABC transporter substrate-binding protein n=1 Tax=Austwickia sp. TVS 96-490-7B TaxID=2830843 RepID=UPI001C59D76B|nr:ABC transporter substrate-binding protein [Austwickia sp. TVS 96-490-7B]MBW3085509.1 Vitamin B12-binding protein [Austwickia sp. TVS 96-490-7B]
MSLNTTRKHRRAVTIALLSALALTGCGQSVSTPQASGSSSAATVTLTNCGADQTYPVGRERIVALGTGQADLIARLGAAKKVVAVAQTHGEKLPGALEADGHKVDIISKDAPPTKEQLLGARPDLVLSPTTYEFTAEKGYATQDQLRQSGAQVYVAAAGCFQRRSTAEVTDLLTDIDALGKIIGAEKTAAELRAQAETQLKTAKDRAQGKTAPTVAQLFIEGDTITAIGAGVEHSMAAAAGGTSVFSPTDEAFSKFFAAEVSRETIVAKNPQVIVFTTTGPDHEKSTREWLKKHLGGVKAVHDDRLVAIPGTHVLPGTWGTIDAVTTMNKAFYPQD